MVTSITKKAIRANCSGHHRELRYRLALGKMYGIQSHRNTHKPKQSQDSSSSSSNSSPQSRKKLHQKQKCHYSTSHVPSPFRPHHFPLLSQWFSFRHWYHHQHYHWHLFLDTLVTLQVVIVLFIKCYMTLYHQYMIHFITYATNKGYHVCLACKVGGLGKKSKQTNKQC